MLMGLGIQEVSEDVLQINQGWIEAEWKVSELGRRAEFYHLTGTGRRST
jgi:hypothetical protein